jgi:hypothetical protein
MKASASLRALFEPVYVLCWCCRGDDVFCARVSWTVIARASHACVLCAVSVRTMISQPA